MPAENEVMFDVQMQKKEEDKEGTTRGRLGFRVSDETGSPFTQASIVVSGDSYEKEKSPRDHGLTQWFEDVPLPVDVTIEATGYKIVQFSGIGEGDLGSSKTSGY